MKKLICVREVEALKEQGGTIFYIDSDTIITPSARDAAEALGIEFLSQEQERTETGVRGFENLDINQIYQLFQLLMEKGLLNDILKPYDSETHSNGMKVVRGNTVHMEAFSTGNPNANVHFQELIGKEESHMSAGFLVIDHSEFEWELAYEEIDYVIEGTLHVTIDGKKYSAHPGDMLYVPAGSKVIWGSPDKVRLFYTTYPSNWADQH